MSTARQPRQPHQQPSAALRVRTPGAIPTSTHKAAISAAQMDAARDTALFGLGGATQMLHAEALETALLSAAEERALFIRVRAGDAAALDQAIRANVRLVGAVARFYLRAGDRSGGAALTLELDDLMQEGLLGLWKAAQRYDPASGNRFSTYATWWIRQSITRALVNSGSAIRLPAHLDQRCRQIMHARSQLELELGRLPSAAEIAQALTDAGQGRRAQGHRAAHGGWRTLQLTAQEVEEALAAWALRRAPVSLEAGIVPHSALGARSGTGNDQLRGDEFALVDLLTDPGAEEAFVAAETRLDAAQPSGDSVGALIARLRARGRLTARDVEIIERRVLRGESRETIGRALGIVHERVRQLERRAFERIQRERQLVRRRARREPQQKGGAA